MALVEIFHVVADQYDVDTTSSNDIKEGMLVTLNGANGVRRVDASGNINTVLGLAGDTKSSSASAMPGVASGWQNRASDSFDETSASGKLTVYHSGGVFATDQFTDTNMAAANIGQILVANTSGLLDNTSTYANVATAIAAGRQPVAMLLAAAGSYPSGVPGVDINGDIALGGDNSNEYITIKVLV